MSKLQKICINVENTHSDGDLFLSINSGQCYLIVGPDSSERYLYIDENGHVYNEHNKPGCCTGTSKLDRLEREIQHLQNEIDCIRRGD